MIMFYLKEEITNGLLALYFCLKRNHCLHLISLNFLLLAFWNFHTREGVFSAFLKERLKELS